MFAFCEHVEYLQNEVSLIKKPTVLDFMADRGKPLTDDGLDECLENCKIGAHREDNLKPPLVVQTC